jgi:hypothetical protein
VILPDFAVAYGDYSRGFKSRTKQAIMVRIPRGFITSNSNGEPFRVDPYFAGTETDNFITRELIKIQADLKDIIIKELNI